MFANRAEAGRKLAERLDSYLTRDPAVLALPRGGVPVGFEIAKRLRAPLDLVLVRKIGAPDQPELALGAIADGPSPEVVLNEGLLPYVMLPEDYLRRQERLKLDEIERRRAALLGGRQPLELGGRTAIVVDDGIATGATMRAALRSVRKRGARGVVLAVPVAPRDTVESLRGEVDDLVCLRIPSPFYAIGAFYSDFAQLSDEEVARLLKDAAEALYDGDDDDKPPAPAGR